METPIRVRDVIAMVSRNEQLRRKVMEVITTVESHGLFVHSGELTVKYQPAGAGRAKSIRLPLIAGSCVLNALVPRSAMLLVGGHGGGKTTLVKLLGRMMTGRSIAEIEDAILRGHPQLTEEKMVATLRPGPLMKEGREVVVWRRFVTDFWKIVDEVNRLTPHAQNILLSMLAEGELKYYDEVRRCEEYCLFATMNPTDSGTFELAPPFLDRFGLAVPITMPRISDLEIILGTRDERLFGYDELWQVPGILTEEDLLTIWNLADKMAVSHGASEYIRSLVREFDACVRVDKSQSGELTVDSGLCDGCHYNIAKTVCNKVVIPLSVRAAKDLNRYSKALAWLVGADEVSVDIVKSIAPLVFWHRTRFVRDRLAASPFYGDRYEFTCHLVELATARFVAREPARKIMARLQTGDGSRDDIQKLQEIAKSDLLVRLDYLPVAKKMIQASYEKMVHRIDAAIAAGDVKRLSKVYAELVRSSTIPNRAALIGRVSDALHRLTLSQYTLDFRRWSELWTTISMAFPEMTPFLKETLHPPKRRVIRMDQLTLVIYVTGDSPDSSVFLEVSGGTPAIRLRRIIEEGLGQVARR